MKVKRISLRYTDGLYDEMGAAWDCSLRQNEGVDNSQEDLSAPQIFYIQIK